MLPRRWPESFIGKMDHHVCKGRMALCFNAKYCDQDSVMHNVTESQGCTWCVQIEALTADKRNFTKLLHQRDAEIDDLHKRHRQSLVRLFEHFAKHITISMTMMDGVYHCLSVLGPDEIVMLHLRECEKKSFRFLQEKIVSLSDANATLDAAAHEAKAAQNRVQQEKV